MLWPASTKDCQSGGKASQTKVRINLSSKDGSNKAVIGKQRGNNFRKIFAAAQDQLRAKFGMELIEVPSKEKVTMKEKRSQFYRSWIAATTYFIKMH